MRVTANEVLAAWVELDREAPYHTEPKPVGHDRKQHEGPQPTNEDFPNSWLPTEKVAPEKEQCAVEQIEVLTVEVAGMRHADAQVIPGVPTRLFKAWEMAHDAELDFVASYTARNADLFARSLVTFAREIERLGTQMNPDHLERLENYTHYHRPDRGDEYSIPAANEVVAKLDEVLARLHGEASRLTNTSRDEWYMYQAEQMQTWQKPQPGSPQELRERRGPMSPFLEEMWQRKRKHELTGMRVYAVDVKRPRKKKQDSFDEAIDQTVQELEGPHNLPPMYDEGGKPIAPAPPPEPPMDPSTITKTIGEWDWEEQDESEGVQGGLFSYRKTITLEGNDDNNYDNALEFYAFVEPLAVRKKRLMDRANRLRSNAPRGGSFSADEAMAEAEAMPDTGYINDIEVFYRGELFFHRERAFRPGVALTSREFMSGDSMQRAVTDLQQYVRTKIDPVPVGQWFQHVNKNPGKGEAKLSHVVAKKGDPGRKKPFYAPVVDWIDHQRRKQTPGYIMQPRPWNRKFDLFKEKESMRITSAEVIPFDPRRRKGPQQAKPPLDPGMEQAYQEDFGMMQGDIGGDVEALFYFYDNIAGSLSDVRDQMVSAVQAATPEQKGELARLIRNIERAIQVLGQ